MVGGRAKASEKKREEGAEGRREMRKQHLDHTTSNDSGSTAVSWDY